MMAALIYFKPLISILRKERRCLGRPARRKTWNNVWFKQVDREWKWKLQEEQPQQQMRLYSVQKDPLVFIWATIRDHSQEAHVLI